MKETKAMDLGRKVKIKGTLDAGVIEAICDNSEYLVDFGSAKKWISRMDLEELTLFEEELCV